MKKFSNYNNKRRVNFLDTKNCGGESEGGQKFLPPNPFLFARPSVQFRFYRASRGNQLGFCSK